MPCRSCPPWGQPRMATGARGDESSLQRLNFLYVGRVDLHADGLPDEIDREHEAGLRPLPGQATDDAFERAVRHLDHRAGLDHRARIVGERAFDERPDALDLLIGHRRGLAVERHDRHHTRALQDGEATRGVESNEHVTGEQREVYLLLAILPAAPPRDRRQESRDFLLVELCPDDLLVATPGPDGEPAVGRARQRISSSACPTQQVSAPASGPAWVPARSAAAPAARPWFPRPSSAPRCATG